MSARKEYYNQLIEDFKELKYSDDNSPTLFYAVRKSISNIVEYPSCEIIPTGVTVTREGITMDSRFLGFRSIVREKIEANRVQDDDEFDRKIERLCDIEDAILDYLQQIPHPLEHIVEDSHMYRIDTLPANYFYEDSTEGVVIYQTIDFNLVLDIHVKEIY